MIAYSFYKTIIIRLLKVQNEWVVYNSNGFSPKTINNPNCCYNRLREPRYVARADLRSCPALGKCLWESTSHQLNNLWD